VTTDETSGAADSGWSREWDFHAARKRQLEKKRRRRKKEQKMEFGKKKKDFNKGMCKRVGTQARIGSEKSGFTLR
jgi:hypothetical protein